MSILLEPILHHAPCAIFWKNLDGVFLGCNQLFLVMSGLSDYSELVGKKDSDMRWKEYADKYVQDDLYVITTGKMLTNIENIPAGNRIIVSETTKAPLIENGKIVGVVGTCLDITDRKETERLRIEVERKEAERLKLENEAHKAHIEDQEKFTKIAAQVAHDIKSPTASLLMLVKSCQDIPEKERIALREATMRIQDIASNFLNYYTQQEVKDQNIGINEKAVPILASTLILELLAEKKLQYQDFLIKFENNFSQTGHFAFIKTEPSAFKRMLSNLINNSVDASEGKEEKVSVNLDANNELIKVIIQDNGKGIRPALVEKIMNNVAVTEGKKQGYGLGLTQARETLQRNQGELAIDSEVGKGTTITLTFPKIKAPSWIAEQIILSSDYTVIILDDDTSIHGAWDAHFEPILKQSPTLQLKHFTIGQEALDFINNLTNDEKKKIFLLSDYELLRQGLNGLDVIEKSGLRRAILVTSHYANPEVRARAEKMGTRILPKLLASEIPILLEKSSASSHNMIELVVIDDNPMFLELLVASFSSKKKVEGFHNPHHFLKYLTDYSKDTIICFDYDFQLSDIDGLKLAELLYNKGYKHLYMISGMSFRKDEIPPYLTLIDKGDMSILDKL